nr:reverse transcriptase domain-containing protein [Tanacetum cinerariifolium]
DYLRFKKCLSNLSTPGGQGFSKTDWPELETKAEIAFRQMKKSIADLPMLTALKEKEELIIYLTATKEAISAVLMTKRDGKQMPVCFVSRALQGPEINYNPIEKLILSLKMTLRTHPWKIKRNSRIHSFAHLSKHVLVEELKEKSIDEKEVLAVLEEEGRTWMTSVYKYLVEGILSDEKKKARAVRRKAS